MCLAVLQDSHLDHELINVGLRQHGNLKSTFCFRRYHGWQRKQSIYLACKFLNSSKEIKGVTFAVGDDGEVQAQRMRLRYPLGHSEELGRLCFRYKVWGVHDAEASTILGCL